jgi:predicted DNA-binding protein (MmcQ/YjbR family)
MNIEEVREYCVLKPCVTESFPFDEETLVFKVQGKMFALLSLGNEGSINLKCDPERAVDLREKHSDIVPGYHMNKVHWNTVMLYGSLSDDLIMEMIDHSYDLVVKSLTRKLRDELLTR